jgi:hypothetical protein
MDRCSACGSRIDRAGGDRSYLLAVLRSGGGVDMAASHVFHGRCLTAPITRARLDALSGSYSGFAVAHAEVGEDLPPLTADYLRSRDFLKLAEKKGRAVKVGIFAALVAANPQRRPMARHCTPWGASNRDARCTARRPAHTMTRRCQMVMSRSAWKKARSSTLSQASRADLKSKSPLTVGT